MFLLVLFFAPKKRTEKDRTFFCTKNNAINSLIIDLNITNGCKVDVGVMERRYVNDDGAWQRQQLEVDFVVNNGNQRHYIQSAFAIPDEAKRQQETASLLRISNSFNKVLIVNDDIVPWRDENGILTIGLLDFLMNPDSLNN